MGIFGPKTPFSSLWKGWGEMGVFGARNPLFQEMGIRALVGGRGNPNSVCLVDVSETFLFFSARGRGRGSPRRGEGKGAIFYGKSQEGGGGLPGRWGRVGKGPGGCLLGIWGGGGAKHFFSGPKCPLEMFNPDLQNSPPQK